MRYLFKITQIKIKYSISALVQLPSQGAPSRVNKRQNQKIQRFKICSKRLKQRFYIVCDGPGTVWHTYATMTSLPRFTKITNLGPLTEPQNFKIFQCSWSIYSRKFCENPSKHAGNTHMFVKSHLVKFKFFLGSEIWAHRSACQIGRKSQEKKISNNFQAKSQKPLGVFKSHGVFPSQNVDFKKKGGAKIPG